MSEIDGIFVVVLCPWSDLNRARGGFAWEIEEADGTVGEALQICEAAIIRYELGLMEARKN